MILKTFDETDTNSHGKEKIPTIDKVEKEIILQYQRNSTTGI